MKSILNGLVILSIMILVLSCGLFSKDELATTSEGNSTESEAPGGSGGSETESDDGVGEDNESKDEKDEKTGSLNKTTRVRFAKGSTSRSYNDVIKKGGSHTFTLAASKGQDMDVELSAKKNNAKLRVLDPAGKNVPNDGSPAIFSATLPATGTYKIIVSSAKGDDSFTVDFIVAGSVKQTPVPPKKGGITKTVKFSKGKSSASYEDAVVLGTRNNYILGASGGQQMSVNIRSLENNAVFQIRGPNGYLRGAGPGTDKRSWSGQLPANGKYTIIVGSTRGNATYTVTFAIR